VGDDAGSVEEAVGLDAGIGKRRAAQCTVQRSCICAISYHLFAVCQRTRPNAKPHRARHDVNSGSSHAWSTRPSRCRIASRARPRAE
jgi:hypothetical protein